MIVPVRIPTSPLFRPPFRGFLAARVISQLGTSMSTVALAFGVLDASGAAADLGIVLASSFGPHLVLLLVGGAVADRFSRRAVLVVANLGAGLAQAGVAVVLLTGRYSLPLVAGLAVLNGALEAFASPALRGVVPELVAPADLRRANSLLASTRHAIRILGPAVAGVVAATANGGWAVAFDALTFLVAAAFLSRLPALPGGTAGSSLLSDIRHGWREFRARTWVWAAAGAFCVVNLATVGPWQVLGPALTGAAGWGLVLSVRAVGLLVTSLVAARFAPRRPLRSGALFAALGGLPLVALGLDGGLPVLAVCAFVGAIGTAVFGVAWDTALQQHVPGDVLSRVASYDDLLSFGAIPLSLLLVGPAAATWGAGPVVVACGAACAVSALAPLAARSFRDLPAHPVVTVRR